MPSSAGFLHSGMRAHGPERLASAASLALRGVGKRAEGVRRGVCGWHADCEAVLDQRQGVEMRDSGRQRLSGIVASLCIAAIAGGLMAGCAEAPRRADRKVELPVFPPPPEPPRFHYERTIYSSADVTRDEVSSLQRIATGETRTGDGLDKPYGVSVRRGRLYVTDTVRRQVAMFDIPAQRFAWLGDDGPGALRQPLGVDTDAQGNVYVADASARRVVVFDASGRFLREIAGKDMFVRPSGVGVNGAGTRLYVVDTGGVGAAGETHRVRAFELPSGRHLRDIGKRGSEPGEFNLPTDVAVAADGSVYVVDAGNFRVQVFDGEGRFLRFFGALGRRGGQFARPKELALDAASNVYIVDAAFGNFQIFDMEGRLLLDVGSRGTADEPAKYLLPSGIAVDEDGRVYVVDQFFRKVDVYRPAGLQSNAGFAVAGAATSVGNAPAAAKPPK
jgi:sugar lactone lactonase YvrE